MEIGKKNHRCSEATRYYRGQLEASIETSSSRRRNNLSSEMDTGLNTGTDALLFDSWADKDLSADWSLPFEADFAEFTVFIAKNDASPYLQFCQCSKCSLRSLTTFSSGCHEQVNRHRVVNAGKPRSTVKQNYTSYAG